MCSSDLALLQTNRADAALNSLSAHLAYARSEAVKRSSNVSLAGLDTDNSTQWELGWVVFVDNNSNGILDLGEQQLRVVNALNIPDFTVTPVNANSVTYDSLGAMTVPNSFNLIEEDKSGTIKSDKTLAINNIGRVSITDHLKLKK